MTYVVACLRRVEGGIVEGMENGQKPVDYSARKLVQPPQVRSKIANGAKLLPLTDGRSATARRFRDLIEAMCADLGGAVHLSESERQLVRRAALLSAESERIEAQWARGEEEFDLGQYCIMSNNLRRLCETLGLRRVPRVVNKSLADILAEPDP
jgi:hypothetical protein